MPPIFKPMATVMAWLLYIVSWVMGLSTFVMGMVTGALYSTTPPTTMIFPILFSVSLAYGIGAVVVMVLRKKLE
jgi:hypothetical protein